MLCLFVVNKCQLSGLLGFPKRNVLVNSFVLSRFNCCTLVWIIASFKFLTKIENVHKRTLRFILDNYSSSYERLLGKSGKFSMDIKRKQTLHWDALETER